MAWRSFFRAALEYVGFGDSEEHSYPGHICGVDCDRTGKGWFETQRGRRWALTGAEIGATYVLVKFLAQWMPTPFELSYYSRNFICELILVALWLATRRLGRHIADISHREGNRLAWVSEAAANSIWAFPAGFMALDLVTAIFQIFNF